MSHLHRAARLGKYNEVADCLAQGEDIDAIGIRQLFPLMLAAREGHADIVKLLLKAGANVHLTHSDRRTALHYAARTGRLPVIQVLVAHGANVNALSKAGRTPALEAAQFNHREVVAFLQAQGTDMTLRDREEMTADDWLAQGGVFGRARRLFPEEFPTSDNPNDRPLAREGDEEHRRRTYSLYHGRRSERGRVCRQAQSSYPGSESAASVIIAH